MGWKRLQDPRLQKRLHLRARIIALVREFFVKEGFLEVETPIVVPYAGQEPYLNPLETKIWDEKGKRKDAYLITSPEYAHKKLLAAGFKKTFEITKAFRAGESWGGLHNPEFTILEWYRAGADYTKIMEDVEKMVQFVKSEIRNPKSETNSSDENLKLEYQNRAIDCSSPWERLTVTEAFQNYAGVDAATIQDDETFFKIFLTHIEPKLGFPKPTILYEYPASMAALARIVAKPRAVGSLAANPVAQRFEVYIAGMELANAFSELNDVVEQRRRFLNEQKARTKLGKEIIPLDEDFLDAVAHMPPSAGIALGVDRLAMLLTGARNIEDILTFPARELWH